MDEQVQLWGLRGIAVRDHFMDKGLKTTENLLGVAAVGLIAAAIRTSAIAE